DSGGVSHDNIFAFDGATVSAIAPSPRQAGLIWAGSDDGLVHLTRDGGTSWRDLTAHLAGLPHWATITSIDPSPAAAGTAYVSADAHMQGDDRPLIYKTSDYGATWRALGQGIPASVFSYVSCVRMDPARPGLLYAGTQNGLYFSLDDGAHWNPLQLNLPHAPVSWIEVQPRFGDLVVATFGRGVYILDDLSPLRQLNAGVLAAPATLFVPHPAYRFRPEGGYIRNQPLPGWQAPAAGASINYCVAPSASGGDASLAIFDASGRRLRTLRVPLRAGINRVYWDMREEPARPPLLLTPPPDAPWVPVPPGGRRLRTWDLDFSLDGPMVPPGLYTLRLTAGGRTLEQHLRLLKDPHSSASLDDIAQQASFARQIRDSLDATAALISRMETLRRDRRQAQAALAIESKLVDVHLTGAREDQFRHPDQLWAQWATLNHEISDDSADFAPTAAQRAAFARFAAVLEAQRSAAAGLR
ncbi:MAG: WD40/YVTN/BNR-like repeat-containing protein, partial [Terriglobales bacterium]